MTEPETFETLAVEYRTLELQRRQATALYSECVRKMLETYPQAGEALITIKSTEGRMKELEENFTSLARNAKRTLSGCGIEAKFSDPHTNKIDADILLQRFPDAARIKGLLKQSVDKEVLEAAVAAGMIPADAAAAATTRVPTSKNGSVKLVVGA